MTSKAVNLPSAGRSTPDRRFVRVGQKGQGGQMVKSGDRVKYDTLWDWIVDLSRRGMRPADIAERLGTSANYVRFVRSKAGVAGPVNDTPAWKRLAIVRMAMEGKTTPEIASAVGVCQAVVRSFRSMAGVAARRGRPRKSAA
jgi:hypothetical protein